MANRSIADMSRTRRGIQSREHKKNLQICFPGNNPFFRITCPMEKVVPGEKGLFTACELNR
jgi:hypothetical protein